MSNCSLRSLRIALKSRHFVVVRERKTCTLTPPQHGGARSAVVRDGRLAAVIDFGCSGVGDPACDLSIAWTFLSGQGREAFRVALPLNAEAWARGRGWALWKASITFAGNL